MGKIVRRLLDLRLPPRQARRRRLTETEKFYLFDVGVANHLARRRPRLGSAEFGKAFEHYILMELRAYQAYRQPDLDLAFWRTWRRGGGCAHPSMSADRQGQPLAQEDGWASRRRRDAHHRRLR